MKLAEYRRSLQDYLHNKMHAVAPNLQALIGDQARTDPPHATRAAQAAGRGPSCCAAQPARDLLIDRVPTPAPDAGWRAPHLARRLAHKPVQVPGVDSPDPWRREGALPRSEDQGQHTKVLAHPPGCSAHPQL
eukprot:scaffold10285_cov105-Isochrysis_galbana.AAC.5